MLLARHALAQPGVPQGVRRRDGRVEVRGNDIMTGADGRVVFVKDRDAVMLRPNSRLSFVSGGFRLLTGAVLAVFAPNQPKQLSTPTAAIGIRGTGIYLEVEPGRTYACTCYGEAILEPIGNPAARQTVRTRHHEQPRWIMAAGSPQAITIAPVINHTDAEIELLEALAGRNSPFPIQSPGYGPR